MLWVSVMYCKVCFFYGVLQLELTRNVIITVYGVVNLFNLFYFAFHHILFCIEDINAIAESGSDGVEGNSCTTYCARESVFP